MALLERAERPDSMNVFPVPTLSESEKPRTFSLNGTFSKKFGHTLPERFIVFGVQSEAVPVNFSPRLELSRQWNENLVQNCLVHFSSPLPSK